MQLGSDPSLAGCVSAIGAARWMDLSVVNVRRRWVGAVGDGNNKLRIGGADVATATLAWGMQVTWEDQQRINSFGTLNNRLHEVRAELGQYEVRAPLRLPPTFAQPQLADLCATLVLTHCLSSLLPPVVWEGCLMVVLLMALPCMRLITGAHVPPPCPS